MQVIYMAIKLLQNAFTHREYSFTEYFVFHLFLISPWGTTNYNHTVTDSHDFVLSSPVQYTNY